MNFAALHTILVTFGPVTPEFTLLTITPFVAIWQRMVYHTKYLRISWTYIDLLYRFGSRTGGYDYPDFVWRSPKGHCYGNQSNLGDVHKHHQERPLLFASAFNNRLVYRKSTFKRSNVYIMYKFCELPSNNLGVYAVKMRNFCRNLTTLVICHVGIPKQIGRSRLGRRHIFFVTDRNVTT